MGLSVLDLDYLVLSHGHLDHSWGLGPLIRLFTEAGLVIITGCSHSGICNITEYAKEVCGDSRVLDIIGGFHLLEPSEERMRGTLEYLKKLGPGCVRACHCTDLNSKIELSKVCRLKEVGVGLQIEYF